MSEFQELSQAIGVAVHKEVEFYNHEQVTDGMIAIEILRSAIHEDDSEIFQSVKELVNHTIKNTEEYQARMESEEQARKDEAQAIAEAEASGRYEHNRGRRH